MNMDQLKTIIVDDEPLARESLRNMLADYVDGILVAGEGGSVSEARELIQIHSPDLVFLDIDMPQMDGFKLFDFFHEVKFHTIFATAHNQFAVKAFRFSAVDYLLKPIDPIRLQEAVEKVRQRSQNGRNPLDIGALISGLKEKTLSRLAIPTTRGLDMILIADILRCEADGNYCLIHLKSGGKIVSSQNIGYFEDLLVEHKFLRIHQRHMVNLDEIVQYIRGRGGQVVMTNGEALTVANRRKGMLVSRLKRR